MRDAAKGEAVRAWGLAGGLIHQVIKEGGSCGISACPSVGEDRVRVPAGWGGFGGAPALLLL